MMSPDGKWVWNGHEWLPVAVHESVFPAYTEATATAAAPSTPFPPVQAAPLVTPPAVVTPAIVQPTSYTAEGATPPWQPPAGTRSNFMYIGAAFVVVLIGVVMTIAFTQSWLPFLEAGRNQNASAPTPAATATPPLEVRSEFALAGRYIDTVLNPATSGLSEPFTSYGESCNGTLSFSCQDAVDASDAALKKAIAALSAAHPPPCIAKQVAKVQADLNTMEAGVQGDLKAYKDNNRAELLRAMAQMTAGNRPFAADVQAISKAQAAACDGQEEGP
jgi:hypothetical protein